MMTRNAYTYHDITDVWHRGPGPTWKTATLHFQHFASVLRRLNMRLIFHLPLERRSQYVYFAFDWRCFECQKMTRFPKYREHFIGTKKRRFLEQLGLVLKPGKALRNCRHHHNLCSSPWKDRASYKDKILRTNWMTLTDQNSDIWIQQPM